MPVSAYKSSTSKEEHKQRARRRRKRRERNRQREDRNVLSRYHKHAAPLNPDVEFRYTLLRPERKQKSMRKVPLENVTDCSWDDADSVLTGSITLQMEERERDKAPVVDGNVIKCEVRWNNKWKEVWRMRITVPSAQVSDDTLTLTLADDLDLVQRSKGDFKFTKEKEGSHKNGWFAHEILEQVAKDYNFKLGRVDKATYEINDLTMQDVSALDPIIKAYKLERENTGKRYVMRWVNGRLNVLKLRRQELLYSLREQIVDAVVEHDRGAGFCTALIVRGNLEGQDSNKKEAIEVTVEHKQAIEQYGYIIRSVNIDSEVKSKEELRERGKRMLANRIRRKTDDRVSLTHVGIPFIRRGDAVRINLPEYGFKDKRRPVRTYKGGHYSILFVASISHSVSNGDYTMSMEFALDDPVADMLESIRDAKNREKREEKRKKKKDEDKGS